MEESRIVTEAAIFADKCDINEELTRLESHVHNFQKHLSKVNQLVENSISLFRK